MTNPTGADDPLLTPKEVAQLLKVSHTTVNRWAAQGRIPTITTPGGHYRIRQSTITALLNPHRNSTTP